MNPFLDFYVAQVWDIMDISNNSWSNVAKETARLIYTNIGELTVSPDGKYIAATVGDNPEGEAKLWQVTSRSREVRIPEQGEIKTREQCDFVRFFIK